MSKRSPRGKASMLDARAHIIYIDGKIGPNIPPQALCPHFPVNIFAGSREKPYLWRVVRLTTPSTPFYMSKVRIPINPMQVGRVGAYSMYVRSGEQIVRQRKNSSNYGPEASRTESQMTRRVKWSSLVNFYKVCSAWMPKAYETLKQGQTVYNKFMQLNINKAHCALTKDMAQNGCCCIEDWTVSQGSLSPIELDPPIGEYGVRTNIVLASAINATTTVKSLSEDIIANNSTFQNGDNIAMVWFKNYFDSRTYPFAVCEYFEFTLDTGNTALLNTTEAGAVIASGNLTDRTVLTTKSSAVEENGANAFVFIHTRKVGGQLKVSTQDIYVSVDDYTDPFTGSQAVQAAIGSYGVTEEVPLDPSFSSAVVSKVLWNGSVIYQKGVTQGRFRIEATEGGELEIQGTGLNSRDVKLGFFDGSTTVEYTPLEVTANSWKYILTGNGYYTLVGNKYLLGSLTLSDIEPSGLSLRRQMGMLTASQSTWSQTAFKESVTAECINYAHKVGDEYVKFRLGIPQEESSHQESDFTFVNCTCSDFISNLESQTTAMNLTPIDTEKICRVEFNSIIIAVFNYEN